MEWKISDQPILYPDAVAFMEQRVADIKQGAKEECIWLLEHPALYTAGTSARAEDLLNPQFPVYQSGRGGQYTYHGPGQRIIYPVLDLRERFQKPDIKKYVWMLEEWIIQTLGTFQIKAERREGRIGIWVETENGDKKIAAIGVRVRHWIAFHGISVNINPDLAHFNGIVPCGISDAGVTSMHALGEKISYKAFDAVLQKTFLDVF